MVLPAGSQSRDVPWLGVQPASQAADTRAIAMPCRKGGPCRNADMLNLNDIVMAADQAPDRSSAGGAQTRAIGVSKHQIRQTSLSNISSTVRSNSRAILNASGSEGSYLPFSIAFTEFLDTPSRLARSACVQRRSARKTRILFFISIANACARYRLDTHHAQWPTVNTTHDTTTVKVTPNPNPIAVGDKPLFEKVAMFVIAP